MSEEVSERSGGRERSELSGVSEQVSSASERANGRASGPVLSSLFLFVPDHSALVPCRHRNESNMVTACEKSFSSSIKRMFEQEKNGGKIGEKEI